MLKRIAGFFMVVIAAAFLVNFFQTQFGSGPDFKPGDKVRITRSSEHALSFYDGQKPWMPAEGWWRLTVIKNEGDGWVKVRTHSPVLVRYARASTLSPGWMTSSQYVEKYDQAQLNAMVAKQAALAAKVHIPSSTQ